MGKWKYFTDEESVGLTDDLCFKRDRMREFYGYEIIQICGYRSPEHNAEIGGVPDSAHITGQAIDVKAPMDSFMREKLAWAAGAAGFMRVESCPRHMHMDTDGTKPTPDFFPGTDH